MSVLLRRACALLLFALCLPLPSTAGETCFGAAGQQCGGYNNGELQGVATCIPPPPAGSGVCAVSGGSWAHDECCVDHQDGVMCKQNTSQRCSSEWDKAVRRLVYGYQWFRGVDYKLEDNDGTVDRSRYCAKAGAGVHRNDRQYCCSGDSQKASYWDRLARPSLYRCKS